MPRFWENNSEVMHMQRMYKKLVQLLFGLLFIFPLTFDVFVVPFLQLSTRLVTLLKQAPFSFSGEFVMSMSFLLFVAGTGLCYFALQEMLL